MVSLYILQNAGVGTSEGEAAAAVDVVEDVLAGPETISMGQDVIPLNGSD